jgi:hypothetical protein
LTIGWDDAELLSDAVLLAVLLLELLMFLAGS